MDKTRRTKASEPISRGTTRVSDPIGDSGRSGAAPDAPAVVTEASRIEALRRQVAALQRICTLGVLAGGLSHELNNALTPVLNYAKLALRNPEPAYRERALTQIIEAAHRATAIAKGMLGLSRPGGSLDHREPTELAKLLEDVVVLVRTDLSHHRVRLNVKITDSPWVLVNRAQIQQVLLNLLINARQAMSQGGIVELGVRLDMTRRLAELSVADNGEGIAPGSLKRIFEPFYSTKTGPDAAGYGSAGLGLAVCRDIVEAHHGRLRVESRPGYGSTFTVILPACAPPAAPKGQVGAA